jgi:hypothetical protein
MAVAFAVRVVLVTAWFVALVALVVPVTPDFVECGPAVTYVLGIKGATAPVTVSAGEADSECVRHAVPQVAAAALLAGAAIVVSRPMLRRVDPVAGL